MATARQANNRELGQACVQKAISIMQVAEKDPEHTDPKLLLQYSTVEALLAIYYELRHFNDTRLAASPQVPLDGFGPAARPAG